MRQGLLLSLTTALLIAVSADGRAQGDPRAIIQRALKAQGDDTGVRPPKASRAKIKGILHDVDGASFMGELFTQLPDRFKIVLHTEVVGMPLTLIQILDGQKALIWTNHKKEPIDEATLVAMKNSAYANRVAELSPLLNGNEFSLALLPQTKVQSQSAVGLLVSSKGQPDVKLYFEKGSGLLIKIEYPGIDPSTRKDVLREEYLSDYREVRSSAADEETVKAAKISDDTPALLEYLRKWTLSDADRQKIQMYVGKLGDASFQVRERAKADLVALGAQAAPLLVQALKDPDPEVAGRAKECFDLIGTSPDSTVIPAVIRLLAERRPAGVVEVFLAYLLSAPDENVVQEVEAALALVAYRDGKPDKALLDALEDKNPIRRAAASQVLKREPGGDKEPAGQRVTVKGSKRPFKGVQFHDGKKSMEWELADIQFFNRFDDSVFAKP